MESPLQVAFKGMETSPALMSFIEARVAKLEKHHGNLVHCQVVVEQAAKHQRQGRTFQVRIHLGLRGHELTVDHEPGRDERHTTADAAVRDAFKAADRQLQSLQQSRRTQDSKHHHPRQTAVVLRINHAEEHAVADLNGTEVFFHRNAIVDGSLDDLEEGMTVDLIVAQGIHGAEAHTVHVT